MMKTLHATVSHDMISPIHNIKFFAEEMYTACLERKLNDAEKYHKLLLETNKILQVRVKDLLDQNLIDHNSFESVEVTFSLIATFELVKNILDT